MVLLGVFEHLRDERIKIKVFKHLYVLRIVNTDAEQVHDCIVVLVIIVKATLLFEFAHRFDIYF